MGHSESNGRKRSSVMRRIGTKTKNNEIMKEWSDINDR